MGEYIQWNVSHKINKGFFPFLSFSFLKFLKKRNANQFYFPALILSARNSTFIMCTVVRQVHVFIGRAKNNYHA